jgi:hypothetical protein
MCCYNAHQQNLTLDTYVLLQCSSTEFHTIILKHRLEFLYICDMQIYGLDVSSKFYIYHWDLKSRKIMDRFIFYFM